MAIEKRKTDIISLKIKLSKVLCELSWYMSDDKFLETFPDTLIFLEGYY